MNLRARVAQPLFTFCLAVTQAAGEDELSKAKRELLQAEVRLAKARATVVGAEIDIKIISARLRTLAK